jgi:hypothetical protein
VAHQPDAAELYPKIIAEAQMNKSFLLLFFKKEVLPFLFFFVKKNQKTFA